MEKVAIASDHAGFALKEFLKEKLSGRFSFLDLGPDSDDRVDYPDFAAKLAQALIDVRAPRGIVICGSGIGISIAANRFPQIRAANCVTAEMARLARGHNDANVLALGARLVDENTALGITEAFFSAPFEGGRHTGRVEKLGKLMPAA